MENGDASPLPEKVRAALSSREKAAELLGIDHDSVPEVTIDESEHPAFHKILDSLDKINTNAKALQLWAIKNIQMK